MSTTKEPDRWKRELLLERVRGLSDARLLAFTDAGGMFHGTPVRVRDLIGRAVQHHQTGELYKCEQACVAAEQAILDARISDHDVQRPFTYDDALSCRIDRQRRSREVGA